MQTNPISAQSFKGSYQLPEFDTDRAIELARALRNMEDEFKHQKEEPEKKNKLELALTAAVGLSGMFLIGKKGYKKQTKFYQTSYQTKKLKMWQNLHPKKHPLSSPKQKNRTLWLKS